MPVLAAAVSCAIDKQTGALLLDPDAAEEKVRSALARVVQLANTLLRCTCSFVDMHVQHSGGLKQVHFEQAPSVTYGPRAMHALNDNRGEQP